MVEKHRLGVTIKRYGDERLYNTDSASYLTLDDLTRMVQEGRPLTVWDVSTGKDITAEVLAKAESKTRH